MLFTAKEEGQKYARHDAAANGSRLRPKVEPLRRNRAGWPALARPGAERAILVRVGVQ
jgi:hypothetical protein